MLSRRSLYLKHIAKTSPEIPELEVERTEGVYVVAKDNKKYFDLASGIGPSILGHQHPVVNKAIRNQSERYLHTMVYGMHIQNPQVDFAKTLLDYLPNLLQQVYFLSSGSEAVEAALKMAKITTERKRIIAAKNAYHGSTIGAESLRSDVEFTSKIAPLLPGIGHILFNDFEDLERINTDTACVIMEPVQAEAGIVVPQKDYLLAVKERCEKVGALLIFDEIQIGLGRTGSLFAFEQFGVVPDILILGKAIGGGLPLSAVVSSKDIMQSVSHKVPLAHLTTFGGHPLCCATGLAVFNYIIENKLWKRAEEIGHKYELELNPIFPKFKRHGAMFGIELDTEEMAVQFHSNLLDKGIISDLLLFNLKMVRMAPPLIIADDEIKLSCERIKSIQNR